MLNVLESRGFRRMFGTKREELILDWRTLHGGGFMIFVFTRYW
jgi:hypothetical protein